MYIEANQTPTPGTAMMPDPASTLRDLEHLLDVPCVEWRGDLAGRGVELDCEGVAAGQAALRQALAGGGTHHDVLGRLRPIVDGSQLSAKRRLIALAVVDVARVTARQRLALAFGSFAGARPAATAA